jgi:hypothetical protein
MSEKIMEARPLTRLPSKRSKQFAEYVVSANSGDAGADCCRKRGKTSLALRYLDYLSPQTVKPFLRLAILKLQLRNCVIVVFIHNVASAFCQQKRCHPKRASNKLSLHYPNICVVVLGLVLSFFECLKAPSFLVTEQSPKLGWFGWILAVAGTLMSIFA